MCNKQNGVISTLSGKPLTLVDAFTYFDRNISSTENDAKICQEKSYDDTDMLSIIQISDPSDEIKTGFLLSSV